MEDESACLHRFLIVLASRVYSDRYLTCPRSCLGVEDGSLLRHMKKLFRFVCSMRRTQTSVLYEGKSDIQVPPYRKKQYFYLDRIYSLCTKPAKSVSQSRKKESPSMSIGLLTRTHICNRGELLLLRWRSSNCQAPRDGHQPIFLAACY